MIYVISVIRRDANPEYAEQLAAYREQQDRQSRGYTQNISYVEPPRTVDTGLLAVELSEEQWQAVKKAVVETWT